MDILNALPNAIAQGLIWGIMAIGLFITYKILDFADLTVDGSIVTGGAVCAILITSGVHPFAALLVAFIAGLACGLVTAIFHTVMGIPPILSGILTQLMLWSINLKILGRANLSIPSRNYDLVVTMSNVNVANPIGIVITLAILLAFLLVIIGILYLFFGTELGRSIRATGCNQKMAKAQGINTKLMKVIALMLSNGIVALAGGLLAQYQGFADVSMGKGAIVIGLAAIIIGTAIFSKIGRNFALRLSGVAFGGIIYFIVYQIVIGLGLDTDLLKMLSAIIVAIFLAVPYWQKKLRPILIRKGIIKPKKKVAQDISINDMDSNFDKLTELDESVENTLDSNESSEHIVSLDTNGEDKEGANA